MSHFSTYFDTGKQADFVTADGGFNWKNEDQFGDHIVGWCIVPDCNPELSSYVDKIHSCLGCGKVNDGSGWSQMNCLLCGYKTELNCSSISKYCVDGFINTLRVFDHPIRLLITLSAIATAGLSSIRDEPYMSYGIWMSYVTTGLTTLSLFIKKETE